MVKRLTNNGLHLFNNNKAKIDGHRNLLKNKKGNNSKMNVKIKEGLGAGFRSKP